MLRLRKPILACHNKQESCHLEALAEQGQEESGIAKMRQAIAALQAIGTVASRPYHLALLAEAYGKVGQTEEGLTVLAEALAVTDESGQHSYEAELYHLKGQLLLQKSLDN